MAIAARCEACQVEASAQTPSQLHTFLARHRDPNTCADLAQHEVEALSWATVPAPRHAWFG
jgi:hypothetical protein